MADRFLGRLDTRSHAIGIVTNLSLTAVQVFSVEIVGNADAGLLGTCRSKPLLTARDVQALESGEMSPKLRYKLETQALISLGGDAAERKIGEAGKGCEDDFDSVVTYLEQVECLADRAVFDAYQRYLSAKVVSIVGCRWDWVCNLAAALLRQRRLKGAWKIRKAAWGALAESIKPL